jgi:hypothetical protein
VDDVGTAGRWFESVVADAAAVSVVDGVAAGSAAGCAVAPTCRAAAAGRSVTCRPTAPTACSATNTATSVAATQLKASTTRRDIEGSVTGARLTQR